MTPYLAYLKQLLLFSIALGVVGGALNYLLPAGYVTSALPYLFLLFIAVNLAGYYFLVKSLERKFIKFLNTFLLFTTLKLLLYIAVLVIYILLHRYDAVPFGLTFFILYLFYTVHEIVSLFAQSKKLGKK